MYRRPKFLEVLLEIRREMAHEVDYDVELFAETVRSGSRAISSGEHSLGPDDLADLNSTESGGDRSRVRKAAKP